MKFDGVSELSVEYALAIDYEHEHEHRDAEHEHQRVPEPSHDLRPTCSVLKMENQTSVPNDGNRGRTEAHRARAQ